MSQASKPATSEWILVGMLSATSAASYLTRVNVSIVSPLLMHDLHLSQVEMGRVFSCFALGYAAFQVPGGMLADRWGAPRVLTVSLFGWAAVSALIALVGSKLLPESLGYPVAMLLVLRFLLGVLQAPTFPAAGQGVSQWIRPLRQGRANGIVLGGVGVGSAIAPLALSYIMVRWGWHLAILCSAIPALITAVAWRATTEPKPVVPILDDLSGERPAKKLRWSRSLVLLVTSYSLEGYVSYVFVFWLYPYLVQVRHFTLARAGLFGALPWIFSIVSMPAGGMLSDFLCAGPLGLKWGRRTVPIMAYTLSGAFVVLGAYTTDAYAAVAFLSLATGIVLMVEGPSWATILEIAGPKSGTAGGVMNTGSNIGGLISPALTPILAAYFGWQNALCVAAITAFVAAGLWFGVSPSTSPAEEVELA